MKKNRYAEPVRQTYAKETREQVFKFKDKNGKPNGPKSSKPKKSKSKKRRKP